MTNLSNLSRVIWATMPRTPLYLMSLLRKMTANPGNHK